jgi:hypothetical protein
MLWNDEAGTIEYQLKGGVVTLQLGQEQVLRVRNLEVTPLVDGEVVYLAGSSGVHNDVLRADASLESTSAITIGVVTEPIAAHPGEGYINTFGNVTCNTNHLTEGAAVWLSTVSGATTSTRPTAPDHAVLIGFCIKKAGSGAGRLFISVNNGYELSELHDVLIGAKVEGDLLAWDSAAGVWRNRALSTAPWALKAGDTFTGNVTITNNASLIMSQAAIFNLTRTIPTVVGNYVELASITNVDFAGNVEIWYNAHNNSFSQSKRYFLPLSYNATANTWQKLLAFSSTGQYAGNDADLEINVNLGTAYFRIRRTAGTTAGVADVVFLLGGSADETTWTPQTGTGVGAAPTAFYSVKAEGTNSEFVGGGLTSVPFTNRSLIQAGNFPTIGGAYSLSSWAGTGVRVPFFAVCPTNNGGSTPAAAQVVAVLGREGVNSQAYANFAEIKLRRYEHSGVNARTAMTIALTHGSNASAGTDVLDILSDGRVGVGMLLPTAVLQLKAGTATAGTAPLKLTSGTLTTAPEPGALEYDGTAWYMTTGTTRTRIAFIRPPVTKATADSPYTVADTDETILCNAAAGAMTINLPSAVQSGRKITVNKIDTSSNAITVDASGIQTISGDLTQVLLTYRASITMIADGSNWWLI